MHAMQALNDPYKKKTNEITVECFIVNAINAYRIFYLQ